MAAGSLTLVNSSISDNEATGGDGGGTVETARAIYPQEPPAAWRARGGFLDHVGDAALCNVGVEIGGEKRDPSAGYVQAGPLGRAALAALAGAAVNPSKLSGSAFSTDTLIATVTVNNAPTLGAATGPTLPRATEGVASTTLVSTLLKDAHAGDADAKALQGIAIVGVGGTVQGPGIWQYSLNGAAWTGLPGVSETSALLLPSNASLRFVSMVQLDSAAPFNPATHDPTGPGTRPRGRLGRCSQ